MLYDCRSRSMRHIARTLSIDIDLLFESIKTDKGVFVQYVNTKEQLADMLTKGSLTALRLQCLIGLCCLAPLLVERPRIGSSSMSRRVLSSSSH